jgi:hypothetical protein
MPPFSFIIGAFNPLVRIEYLHLFHKQKQQLRWHVGNLKTCFLILQRDPVSFRLIFPAPLLSTFSVRLQGKFCPCFNSENASVR